MFVDNFDRTMLIPIRDSQVVIVPNDGMHMAEAKKLGPFGVYAKTTTGAMIMTLLWAGTKWACEQYLQHLRDQMLLHGEEYDWNLYYIPYPTVQQRERWEGGRSDGVSSGNGGSSD